MAIEWDPSGSSRNIPAKERGNRGFFPSNKVVGSIVEYESCLERDLFILFEHSPEVNGFQHQPITIDYTTNDGKARKYTPDAFVEFKDGYRALIEVKYQLEVDDNRNKYQERWDAASTWGKERSMVFLVLTELEIRTPRWFNIWFTLGASKAKIEHKYLTSLYEAIPINGEKYSILCALLAEKEGILMNKAAQILCYAIYHGSVFIDGFSEARIDNDTIIRKKQRKENIAFRSLKEELYFEHIPRTEENHESTPREIPGDELNTLGTYTSRIPDEYEEIVNRRKNVIDLWLKCPKQNRTNEWRNMFCKEWNVSIRTIYYWLKLYSADGMLGLIPKNADRGRQSKIKPVLLSLMETCRQIYFRPLKTLRNSYEILVKMCEDAQIPPPTEATFRTYIYRNSMASDFAKKHGPKYYKSTFSPALASFQSAILPMQVLQLDNTNFDVFPVDSEKREKLATPYMTAAMDCYTRMITGFDLSFFPSSSRTVLDVLVQSILPKDEFTQTYSTQSGWPIQGFPVLILVDNGMDYRSKALKDFCMKYDIILEFAPIRTPRYKAFIEQWFSILHKALVEEEVDGFRPLLKQRIENPALKPETEAILTLQECEDWTHKWTLDDYHLTNPYDDHAPAPFLRWEKFKDAQTPIILPLPREPPIDSYEVDMMNLAKLEEKDRTLRYIGINWENLVYNNKQLAQKFK